MPFIGSVVSPTSLSRRPLPSDIKSHESEAIVNNTLSSVLRQLASLSLLADEIFVELRKQLNVVNVRAASVVVRLRAVEETVIASDPKAVLVPESDMCAFSRRTTHFASQRPLDRQLFTPATRPSHVRRSYARAASPASTPRCCAKPKSNAQARARTRAAAMDTSKPALVGALRRWTWAEALGDVTCAPGGVTIHSSLLDLVSDHLLPSPEEQTAVVARTFPACLVSVDISGRLFDRQSSLRRSRPRRARRRNTVAGGDAIAGPSTSEARKAARRSKSESRLAGLKDWGRAKLRSLRGRSQEPVAKEPVTKELVVKELVVKEVGVRLRTQRPSSRRRSDEPINSSSGNWSASSVGSATKSSSPGASSRRQSGSSGRGVSPDACCRGGSEDLGCRDDDDSVYSCDTEGYYTSFHVDSGLKEVLPATAERSTTELCSQSCESQYQLFGKGSTSTTASSNNTVCTALLNPAPPPRLSSLGPSDAGSGRNSAHFDSDQSLAESNQSLVDSNQSSLDSRKGGSRQSLADARNNFLNGPNGEDGNTVDWKSLTARRIPSMCVVTPPTSDDEPPLGHFPFALPGGSGERNAPIANSESAETARPSDERKAFSTSFFESPALFPADKHTPFCESPAPIVKEAEYATLVCRNEPRSPKAAAPTEYVSLRELKPPEGRIGARVTLDSAGKVVFCSDSLRRTKKSFEPGATRSTNQEALGRTKGKVVAALTPVRVVRPTQRGSVSPTSRKDTRTVSPTVRKDGRTVSPTARKDTRTISPTARRELRTDSPTVKTVLPIRQLRKSDSPGLLQTSFDDPSPTDDEESPLDQSDGSAGKQESPQHESEVPPRPANPEQLTNYLQRTNPALYRRISEPKVHRTDSYKLANVRPTNLAGGVNIRHLNLPSIANVRPSSTTSVANIVKKAKNPNLLGRKVYGTELRVDPKLLPASTERAKVLSAGHLAQPMAAVSSTPTREKGVVFDASLSPIGVAPTRYNRPCPDVVLVQGHGPGIGRVEGCSPDLVPVPRHLHGPSFAPNQRYSPNLVQNQKYSPNLVQNQRYSPNLVQNQRYSPNLVQNQLYSPNLIQNQRYSPNLVNSPNSVPNVRYSPNIGQNQRYSPNLVATNERYSPNFVQNQRCNPNLVQNRRYSPVSNTRYSPSLSQGQRQSPGLVPNTRYSPIQRYSPTSCSNGPLQIQRSPLIGRDDFRLLLARHGVGHSEKISAAQRLNVNQSEKMLVSQRLRVDQSRAKENIAVNGRPSFETAL